MDATRMGLDEAGRQALEEALAAGRRFAVTVVRDDVLGHRRRVVQGTPETERGLRRFMQGWARCKPLAYHHDGAGWRPFTGTTTNEATRQEVTW